MDAILIILPYIVWAILIVLGVRWLAKNHDRNRQDDDDQK
jgi:high-affinity Fe2+/Pb2+ permease